MTPEGIARIRACFANAEQVLPIDKAQAAGGQARVRATPTLPQMPQMPQPRRVERTILTDDQDRYEERAAIIEYEGGMPRPLAEFLAGQE
jgi:hypothetical protein